MPAEIAMPVYEYECQKCHREFEELVFSHDPEVCCPSCASAEVKRLLSVTAFKTSKGFASTGSASCGGCSASSCSGCKH